MSWIEKLKRVRLFYRRWGFCCTCCCALYLDYFLWWAILFWITALTEKSNLLIHIIHDDSHVTFYCTYCLLKVSGVLGFLCVEQWVVKRWTVWSVAIICVSPKINVSGSKETWTGPRSVKVTHRLCCRLSESFIISVFLFSYHNIIRHVRTFLCCLFFLAWQRQPWHCSFLSSAVERKAAVQGRPRRHRLYCLVETCLMNHDHRRTFTTFQFNLIIYYKNPNFSSLDNAQCLVSYLLIKLYWTQLKFQILIRFTVVHSHIENKNIFQKKEKKLSTNSPTTNAARNKEKLWSIKQRYILHSLI